MTSPKAGAPPFGFNVIGFVSGNFGLSVAARSTVQLLLDLGYPVRVVDIEAGGGRSGRDTTFRDLESPGAIEAPYAVNLFHANPSDVVNLLRDRPGWLGLDGRLNACVPFWELPKLPQAWVPVLEAMDLVMCPTRFVLEAVSTSAPGAEVVHFPQTVSVPGDVAPNRARFGLPNDRTLFFMSMDLTSDIERKNPFGALEAFRRAFAGRDDVAMVIKVNNAEATDTARRARKELTSRIAGLENVILIEKSVTYRDVLALYASCDVLVSLHRSEGLGLHLMEAMSLGKPVIATGWSGNMDFMDEQDSCLVSYRLVPVESTHASYRPAAIGEGQQWAEPDVDEAARDMLMLAEHPERREELGRHAREDLARTATDPDRSGAIEHVRGLSESGVATRADHEAKTSALRSAARMTARIRLRRAAAAALRRVGLRK